MKLAVYTTIYPGVQKYLAAWYGSLLSQADRDFELWIGLDVITKDEVEDLLRCEIDANWVTVSTGATAARIRQQALRRVTETCEAVVLVDSDDVLHPTRVQAARAQLEDSDLVGCTLALIDQCGKDLGLTFGLPTGMRAEDVLPRNNVFGFSNSAFRTDLLSKCLPIPAETVLVDWYLATRAWLLGARLAFDPCPRMYYRQYAGNTARVRFPFSPEQVISDTDLVRRHFRFVFSAPLPGSRPEREAEVKAVAALADEFYRQIVCHPERLSGYVQALNALQPSPLWWSCVANPALVEMWTGQRVSA